MRDGNDPESVIDDGVDEAVLVEPLHLHLVHVRLGGKVRVLVLFQQMRVAHDLIQSLEHLGWELLAETWLPFVIPVVPALKVLDRLGESAGFASHRAKRLRTSEFGTPSALPSTML